MGIPGLFPRPPGTFRVKMTRRGVPMTDASLLRYVRSWHPTDVGTDNDLLSRFAEGHDEKAFATLVHRHAGLVWGVCRRTLGHSSDAEDAFQATFLVLARNPRKVRKTGSIAGFLFGVARRVALKARKKRSRTTTSLTRPTVRDVASEAAVRELQSVLVQRKPEFGGVGDDDNGSGTGFHSNGTVASVLQSGPPFPRAAFRSAWRASRRRSRAASSLRSRAAWMAGCRPARTSWGVT